MLKASTHNRPQAKTLILTDPKEIEHMLRWRQHQQWIRSLPPNLFKPFKCEHNQQCEALGPKL